MTSTTKKIEIVNMRGLHARASAKFVDCAQQFKSNIQVTKDNQSVNAHSIMGLMMLAASKGSHIEITAEGEDADDAVQALSSLIDRRFDEEN